MAEENNDLYSEFMNNGEGATPPKPTKKNDPDPKPDPEPKPAATEEKPLDMWEFVHHENGNVTMGADMFKKLMDRLLP